MKYLRILNLLVCILLINNLLYAGAGTTSAVVLKESIGARGLAMGEAFVSIANSADAIYWNPAGLGKIYTKQLSAMYLKEIAATNFASINYAHPVAKSGTIGIGVDILSSGDLEINYLDGTSKTVKALNDYIVNIAYGKNIDELGLGTNIKFISSTLAEEETAQTFAVDLGGLYQSKKLRGLSFGINLQNIGSGLQYKEERDPLPFNIKLGVGFQREIKNNLLTITGDLNKPRELSTRLNLGIEYWYNKLFALRGGYKFGYDLDTFTTGFGIKIANYIFDYAYAPKGDLGDNHRLSFTVEF